MKRLLAKVFHYLDGCRMRDSNGNLRNYVNLQDAYLPEWPPDGGKLKKIRPASIEESAIKQMAAIVGLDGAIFFSFGNRRS